MRRDFRVGIVVAVAIVAAVRSRLHECARPWRRRGARRRAAPAAGAARRPRRHAARAPSFDAVHIGPDGSAVIAGTGGAGRRGDGARPRQGRSAMSPPTRMASGCSCRTQPLAPGPQESQPRRPRAGRRARRSPRRPASPCWCRSASPAAGAGAGRRAAAAKRRGRGADGRRSRAHGRRIAWRSTSSNTTRSGRTILSGRADAGRAHRDFRQRPIRRHGDRRCGGQLDGALAGGVPVGRYRLAPAAHGPDGSDAGGLALELRRAAPGEFAAGDYFAVVPGNTLWHLAQRSYGDGCAMSRSIAPTATKIANPDLIYPERASGPSRANPSGRRAGILGSHQAAESLWNDALSPLFVGQSSLSGVAPKERCAKMSKPKRGKSTAGIDRHVGARIRERRILLGLTQQQLARAHRRDLPAGA